MEELHRLLQAKVTEVMEETLENMAFTSVDECSAEEIEELDQQLMGVNLLVTEPVLFEMHLNSSQELLYQLAENMYAMEREELDDQLIKDLLAEILNTVAGLLMTAILPPETKFALGLPELSDEIVGGSELVFNYIAEDCPITLEIKAADLDSLQALLQD
ncbi:MAG: chemotaxis protein CheX [Desulfuromonas sp.]|nr:chemotaxis protein CheX [Desulfuromonas sp.]